MDTTVTVSSCHVEEDRKDPKAASGSSVTDVTNSNDVIMDVPLDVITDASDNTKEDQGNPFKDTHEDTARVDVTAAETSHSPPVSIQTDCPKGIGTGQETSMDGELGNSMEPVTGNAQDGGPTGTPLNGNLPSAVLDAASPNVVVERVDAVGSGILSWNLTASGDVGDQDGEAKGGPGDFPLDFNDASTILTQDQILKIDAALNSEQNKGEGTGSLVHLPQQESINIEDTSVNIEGPSGIADDQQNSEEKMQLSTSTDSLNLESVLDITAATLNTKDLMNQVMSSDLLMDAIGAPGLIGTATDAPDVSAEKTSDGESESGSTGDSTPSKKREQKRRSARIAHIEANDITLRQALREKEQKKKEREEKKRQKEEKKAKEQSGFSKPEECKSPIKPISSDGDINNEIAKYLHVIDQEIKKSEESQEEEKIEGKEENEEEKKEQTNNEVKMGERPNLFENIVKSKSAVEIKSEKDGSGTIDDKQVGTDTESVIEKAEVAVKNDKDKSSKAKEKKGLKVENEDDDKEPGELKEEEKEMGELSDQDETSKGGSVYWMDHSYAASSVAPLSTSSVAPLSTSKSEKQTSEASPTKRNLRRTSRKGKDTEDSLQKESKASKKGEAVVDEKSDKKSGKRSRKEKKPKKGEKKERGRSISVDKRESSDERTEKQGQHRSKSTDKKNEKKERKKDEKKERSSCQSKDGKEEGAAHSTKKSSRRTVKKPKRVDEADLSDIPFSSEEEADEPDRDAGEHDSGSEWTSDDDPEKLWCICRKPHDGKFMICCDQCEEWFHGSCVNITKKEGKRMEREELSWMCPKCTEADKKEAEEPAAKEDVKKMKKQESEEMAVKEESRKEKDKAKLKKDEEGKVDEEKDDKKEKGSEKKGRAEKVSEERRRKRKSDAGLKTEESTKKSQKGGDDNRDKDAKETTGPSSKKKRLKFFRPPPPKQHCIGTHCDNWARQGSVYCSPACIVRHAKESIKLLSAEKERAAGIKVRRESAGNAGGSTTSGQAAPASVKLREDERISVIERHTGRLRTGLTAPTHEELPYWLGRHPTYEVLRPSSKHGYLASSHSGEKSSKKKDLRRLSHDGEKGISSSDTERKISTKQITSPVKEGSKLVSDALEKRQQERREKVRRLMELKRREEEEAKTRENERRWMEESRRRREEEKREEEGRRKKEEEKKRREDRERRDREKREREEKARLQAESSKLAEQTSESVRVNVKRTLVDVLLTRVKKAGDMKGVTADEVKRLSKEIEFELYKLFNDTGAKYKAKYRTLIFNIKDSKNKGLFRHILKREITPRNLVRMSSEQLASQELMKWREEEAKHELNMIVQTEKEIAAMPVHIVKKTHKGEVELGEEDDLGALVPHVEEDPESSKDLSLDLSLDDSKSSPKSTSKTTHLRHHSGSTSPTTPTLTPITLTPMLIDTTEQHKAHLFDLNCKICTGKIPAPQEEKKSKKAIVRHTPKVSMRPTPSTDLRKKKKKKTAISEKPVKFFGEDVEEKMRPQKSVNEDLNDDLYDDLMEMGVNEDDDNDVIIEEHFEEEVSTTPPGSPEATVRVAPKPAREKVPRRSQVKRSSSVSASLSMPAAPDWRGFIFMPDVSKFVAVAHHVSGPAHTIPLDLQDTLEVCGRIPYPVVWEYFTKLQQSQSTEMTVMRFQAYQEDESPSFFALFDYFYTRRRIGVVGKNRSHVKDFYLIALPSSDKVPSQILPFNGPGLPAKRSHMLLGIVVRHKEKPRSLSLDGESVSKPSSHREPATQPSRKKAPQPLDEILPPSNPLSSFRSALPNIREMSDLANRKEPYVPLKTKEVYVSESQLVDPIVAQYANADPKQLEVELEEPYDPTIEEREAPYDPSDPTDDWLVGRRMPSSAVIPEPAVPAVTYPSQSTDKVCGEATGNTPASSGVVQPSDSDSAEADASQDVLSAFSDQSGLSDQQQLLIQLTKQVEEAKKALLDRQIESLRTEISKATGKGDSPDEQSSNAAATSPDVRLAPADSSTMTPKDDVPSTPGNVDAPADIPALVPPPELPPFAVGAVLWKASHESAVVTQTESLQNPPHPHKPSAKVTAATEATAVNTAPVIMPPAGHQQQPFTNPHQQYPSGIQAQQHLPGAIGHPDPNSRPHQPDPVHQLRHHHHQLPHLPQHPGVHHHHVPHHIHRPAGPGSFPDPKAQHHSPLGQHSEIPTHPDPPHHHHLHHHHPPHHSAGPAPQLAPSVQPALAPSKKRKLEPPPPGVEGWKYGDDDPEPTARHEGNRPSKSPLPNMHDPKRHKDWDARPNRDVDRRFDPQHHGPGDEVSRQPWNEGDIGGGHGDATWERESWHERRDDQQGSWHKNHPAHRHSTPGVTPGEGYRNHPTHQHGSPGERPGYPTHRHSSLGEGYRDWPPQDYDGRGKGKRPALGDPRIGREGSPQVQRDYDYRHGQR